MDKRAIKDFTHGGLMEIMKDRQYFYYSEVGPDYCHLTEEGERAIIEFINLVSYKMLEADNEELNQRAKEMVLKSLKGEST